MEIGTTHNALEDVVKIKTSLLFLKGIEIQDKRREICCGILNFSIMEKNKRGSD